MTPATPDYAALIRDLEVLGASITTWPLPPEAAGRYAEIGRQLGLEPAPAPAAGPPRVSILLAAGEGQASLQRCLAALRRTLPPGLAEVLAAPQGVPRPVLEWLRAQPEVRLCGAAQDGAAAPGLARAAAEAHGEFLLLLEAEAEPQPGWLEHLLAALEADPALAAVGARLLTARGTLREAGQVLKLDGRLAPRGEGADSGTHSYLAPVDVDALSRCLLIRRAAFDQAGGFASGSVAAGTLAADLCLRLRRAGQRLAVAPEACVLVAEGRPRPPAGGPARPSPARAAPPAAGQTDLLGTLRAPLLPHPIRVAILVPYHGPECLWGEALIADNLREALEWRPDVESVRIFDYARAGDIDAFGPDLIFSFTAWRQPLRFKRGVTLFYIVNFIHEHMPAGQFLTQEDALRLNADLYAANSASVVEYLSQYKPARLLHLAANPRVHRPLPPTPKYRAAVTYLGAYYPGTKGPEVFDRYILPAAGFDLSLWGTAWETSPDHFRRHWRGELPIADIARLYASVDIALGLNAKSQAAAGMINNRVFEILACGALLLSDRYPAIEAAFGDVAVFTDGYADTRAKLEHYLAHPDERAALVQRARAKILAEHTYDHRARDLVQMYAEYQRSRGLL